MAVHKRSVGDTCQKISPRSISQMRLSRWDFKSERQRIGVDGTAG